MRFLVKFAKFLKTPFFIEHFWWLLLKVILSLQLDIKSPMCLTLSWRRPLSYRNQPIDLLCKSMVWFLYDDGLRHEWVNKKIIFYLSPVRASNWLQS